MNYPGPLRLLVLQLFAFAKASLSGLFVLIPSRTDAPRFIVSTIHQAGYCIIKAPGNSLPNNITLPGNRIQ